MKVLFLNHKKRQCGVYQYGLRLFTILKKSQEIEYIYEEVETYDEYRHYLEKYSDTLNAIIYNIHTLTMPWLNQYTIQRKIKNIGIPHESNNVHSYFNYIINIENNFPRPIFENVEELLKDYKPSNINIMNFINYKEDDIPIFNSFGFGFRGKGLDKIIELIKNKYEKAIIKFVIPHADFSSNTTDELYNYVNYLHSLVKNTGIKLMITHEFFTTEDMLLFLSNGLINIFLYDVQNGRGISSAIDYAISVKKPLGISNSNMFRHMYNDKICLYKVSIDDCIKNSIDYCSTFLNDWSHKNMINIVDSLVKLNI